jgi:hypothetical protein
MANLGKTAAAAIVLLALVCIGAWALFHPKNIWSIGIYSGDSPLSLHGTGHAENPVLEARDVTDVRAEFVADPFMIRRNSSRYMFFEVFNRDANQGDIGLATSQDGYSWKYRQIVLDEPFHLSYPYVFEWDGEAYMIPETKDNRSVRLYKADSFPYGWSFVKTLLDGDFQDSSVFRRGGRWWMFTSDRNDRLRLFSADDLMGPWVEHPESPIVENDADGARPGGRVLEYNGSIIRFAQDDFPYYGNSVRAFIVTKLTPSEYAEAEAPGSPVLQPGSGGWNSWGMHNLDAQPSDNGGWTAAVDGK